MISRLAVRGNTDVLAPDRIGDAALRASFQVAGTQRAVHLRRTDRRRAVPRRVPSVTYFFLGR
jgi:hypothetical protein